MVPYIACRSDYKCICPYVPVFGYMNKMYVTPSSRRESTGIWMHKFNNIEAVKMPLPDFTLRNNYNPNIEN